MSLYNGIDPTAIAALGSYTESYGSGSPANIANLYASLGLFEDAPNTSVAIIPIIMHYLRRILV